MRRVTAPSATGTTVITVGAGASPLVGALLADGVGVIAVDIASAALDALAREVGDAAMRCADGHFELITADVRTLQLDHQVDVWHDRAVFHFLVDAADRIAYATTAAATVRPHGHLVIATFAPDGPTTCSGLPVERHDATSMSSVFGASFDLVGSFEADHLTPWGSTQRFTHAVLRATGA